MIGEEDETVTNLEMHVDEEVSIGLRASLDATAVLAIGDGVEIVLAEAHVRSLRDQATAALGDLVRIADAEHAVEAAYQAASQARTAAALAREQAQVARRAGAREQADVATEAARRATEAADRAQAAVEVASDAMRRADEAAEEARAAAGQAAEAAGRKPPEGRAGTTLRLV